MRFVKNIIITTSLLLVTATVWAQEGKKQDSTDILDKVNINTRYRMLNNIFEDAVNAMKRDPGDTVNEAQVLIEKSEDRFQKYEGRIIRYIIIQRFGFERTFTDTSNRITYFGTRILNTLHTDTKEFIIRQNLFIKEHTTLNPFELADNERYLRTLRFIQDARIFPSPVKGSPDSVDIVVITKDLFTITGVLDVTGLTSVKLRLAEVNLAGMAQRIQATGYWERNRYPATGYELLYSKSNIGGSFVDGTIAYSLINGGRSDGTEDESSFYITLERPLVSPFSHVAGGIEVSYNQSLNVYRKPDSLFLNYKYNYYDGWAGYNIGANKLSDHQNYKINRTRFFISGRYFQTDFERKPFQIGEAFDAIYNSKQAALAQLTVFKQDFYKLNYIYGFGSTEDVPMGYSVSLTGGWYKQLDLERPYGGFQLEHNLVTPRGGFVNTAFKIGGFLHDSKIEDASTLASVSFFTRLFNYNRWKLREFMKFSYTKLDNRVIYEPLRLNNTYGLTEFTTDSVNGNRRMSIYAESILYTKKKILGFRFAPFIFGDFSIISFEDQAFKKSDIYTGLGAGVRTRNENLVFGTIELKAIYFPRTAVDVAPFRVLLTSDLRYRYKTDFVRAPNIIYLNRDDL